METQTRTRLSPEFFARKAEEVARDLLSRSILRKLPNGEILDALIVKTAAYEGGKITPTRNGMLYAPGTIFLMPYRGFTSLNIATDRSEFPSCVEIRSGALNWRTLTAPGDQIKEQITIETPYKLAKELYLSVKDDAPKGHNLDNVLIGEKLWFEGERTNEEIKFIRPSEASDNCLGYYYF